MKNDKYFAVTLLLVFLFSCISICVGLWGADTPVHRLKPVFSIIWMFIMYGSIMNKYPQNQLRNTCAIMSWYAVFSLMVSGGFSYAIMTSVFSGDFYMLPFISISYACINYRDAHLVLMRNFALFSSVVFLVVIFSFRNLMIQQDALSVISDMADEGLSLDSVTKSFCYPSGFLLLLFPLLNKKNKIIVACSFIVALIFALFLARRNLIVTCIMFFLGSVFLYLINIKRKSLFTKIVSYSIVAVSLYFLVTLGISIITGENDNMFFSTLVQRVDSDSRTHVLIPYYKYMNSPIYWIFGHGIDSQYFSDLGWRKVIETGYLHIIMKVGLVGLITYLIMISKAVLKALRGNLLLQAGSVYLLIFVLETVYAGVPTFSLTWVFIWMIVSICNSDYFKSLTNEQIRSLLCQ